MPEAVTDDFAYITKCMLTEYMLIQTHRNTSLILLNVIPFLFPSACCIIFLGQNDDVPAYHVQKDAGWL